MCFWTENWTWAFASPRGQRYTIKRSQQVHFIIQAQRVPCRSRALLVLFKNKPVISTSICCAFSQDSLENYEGMQSIRLNACRKMQGLKYTQLHGINSLYISNKYNWRFSSSLLCLFLLCLQNILAANWQGNLNTIKADAKGRY